MSTQAGTLSPVGGRDCYGKTEEVSDEQPSRDITEPFLYAVSEYRKAGWFGTIPLPPKAKYPPPKGYTGAGSKYPSIEQLKAWCDQYHPDFVGSGNICLHLGPVEVSRPDLPVEFGGHIVTGWEHLGIDIDTYKEKNGFRELQQLQERFGVLPATIRSSSRWDRSDTSYIAVYLVPKGYRYLGKASSCIDIIQYRHRYMGAWPSVNPDAELQRYRWRDADDTTLPGVPQADSATVLPERWWAYLSNNGMPESADPISDLTGGELLEWAAKNWQDPEADPCRDMIMALNTWIERIESSASCHPFMVPAQWQILRLGSEGHKGWLKALQSVNSTWYKHAEEQRDGPVPDDEVRRSVIGALGKIEPTFTGLADDPCECKEAVENGEYDDRISNWDCTEVCACGNPDCTGCDVGIRIRESDYGGLGPVVGRLQLVKDKPIDTYGMHDAGNGEHFIDLYGDNVKYISTRMNWAIWIPPDGTDGGGRWYADMDDKYVALAYERVRKRQEKFAKMLSFECLADPQNGALKSKARAWSTFSKNSGNVHQIKNALKSSQRLYIDDNTPVTLAGSEFDANPRLLGCLNGILELTEDPEIRSPRREDYVTYNTNVPFIPWRTLATNDDVNLDGYHLWQEYLNTFLPDEEIRHFVQKIMGHMLIGENPEKLLVFLYGPHDSGKSTMIGAIAGALGDYYGTIDMNIFKQQDKNPQLVRACPLRVTGMSEVDAGIMDAATIKRLTGNDQIVAELKYSNDIFVGRPQFTTVIACNNPPDINQADDALRERLLALPFTSTIDRDLRKYERQTQIERYSRIAVLSWLVEGWRLYCTEGIKREDWPQIVRQLHGEIVSSLNPTQTFIEQTLIKCRDCKEGLMVMNEAINKATKRKKFAPTAADWPMEWTPPAVKVYDMYHRWCMASGVTPPLSLPAFTRELDVGRPQQRKIDGTNVKCYIGVKIRDD